MRSFWVKNEDILERTDGTKLLYFKNFNLKNSKFNETTPSTNVCVTEECANKLIDAGFNVVRYEQEDGEVIFRFKVKFNFDNERIPIKIYKVCGNKKVRLNKDTIKDLQNDEIIAIDIDISYGKQGGIYANTAYFTIEESEIDLKYSFCNGDDEEPLEDWE